MYEATNKEIIEFIATFNAYGDFLSRSNELRLDLINITEIRELDSTTCLQVIALMLLNDEYKFQKHQDYTRMAEFILFLTGRNKKKIYDKIREYSNSNGEIHTSNKKNLQDYQQIKKLFERIDNKAIVFKIETKIKEIQQRIAKDVDT